MIRMLESLATRSIPQRVAIALILGIAGLFLLGATIGVIGAIIGKGHLPDKAWVAGLPLVTAPLAVAALYATWRLAMPPASATAYEKKYWRMWVWIVLLGAPLGALLGANSDARGMAALNPFTTAPLTPGIAILLALLLAVVLTAAVVLYHRVIDDHEEHAYLWASQVAYYFVIIAVPCWWLLERGDLVGPLTVGWALVVLLASGAIHGAVWVWLKYR